MTTDHPGSSRFVRAIYAPYDAALAMPDPRRGAVGGDDEGADGRRWWSRAEIAEAFGTSVSTVGRWIAAGWAAGLPQRRTAHGRDEIYCAALPPPPPARRRRAAPPRRIANDPRRAAVVAAVLAAGGPPGRVGRRRREESFWARIAAPLGISAVAARERWVVANELGEVR